MKFQIYTVINKLINDILKIKLKFLGKIKLRVDKNSIIPEQNI